MSGGDEFRAKGVAFLGAMVAARNAPGGLDAVQAQMPDSERERLEPLYVAHVWYPLETLVALMHAVAEVTSVDEHTFVRRQASLAAQQDVRGLYKQAMRSGTPAVMARRLPRIFNRYFSPSAATLVAHDVHSMEVEVGPIPFERVEFFKAINEGFVAGALESAGASSISFTWKPNRRRAAGQASIRFMARWNLA